LEIQEIISGMGCKIIANPFAYSLNFHYTTLNLLKDRRSNPEVCGFYHIYLYQITHIPVKGKPRIS
jgi:hypothetical protein